MSANGIHRKRTRRGNIYEIHSKEVLAELTNIGVALIVVAILAVGIIWGALFFIAMLVGFNVLAYTLDRIASRPRPKGADGN